MNKVRQNILKFMKSELAAFRSATKCAKEHPYGENVHRLRVSSRKLRTIFRLLVANNPDVATEKLLRSLKKLSRIAGEERELEVARRDARKYGVRLKKIRSREKTARQRIVKAVSRKRYQRLPEKIERALEQLKSIDHIPAPAWNRNLEALQKWLNQPVKTMEDFHSLRIVVKRARYTLEASGFDIKPLRVLQESLGRLHDLQVLERYTGKSANVTRAIKGNLLDSRPMVNPALKLAMRKIRNIPGDFRNGSEQDQKLQLRKTEKEKRSGHYGPNSNHLPRL